MNLNAIKRLAVFPNPDFYRTQATRLRIYDTPRVFDCDCGDADFLGLPHGCLDALSELLGTFSVSYTLEDRRTEERSIDVGFRGGIVDIAIMQSLFGGGEKEVKPFVAEYGMVICDEYHHVAAFTLEKILRSAKAKYVYGLSSTPTRQD